jgi:hypothetical protein
VRTVVFELARELISFLKSDAVSGLTASHCWIGVVNTKTALCIKCCTPYTCSPQKRHLIASFLISSAQNGHFFISPDRTACSSTAGRFGDATSAKMNPNGPRRIPSMNHPQPLRPLLVATTALMRPKRSQMTINMD